jgi:hypothetical protein
MSEFNFDQHKQMLKVKDRFAKLWSLPESAIHIRIEFSPFGPIALPGPSSHVMPVEFTYQIEVSAYPSEPSKKYAACFGTYVTIGHAIEAALSEDILVELRNGVLFE